MQRVATLRLPTIYQFPEVAEESGFVGYGAVLSKCFEDLMAQQLVQLLRGTKPADLAADAVRAGDQPQDR
jgi:putative ABC transport system substrate-binding protein